MQIHSVLSYWGLDDDKMQGRGVPAGQDEEDSNWERKREERIGKGGEEENDCGKENDVDSAAAKPGVKFQNSN